VTNSSFELEVTGHMRGRVARVLTVRFVRTFLTYRQAVAVLETSCVYFVHVVCTESMSVLIAPYSGLRMDPRFAPTAMAMMMTPRV
jgi:hypothetical protein